MLILAIEILVIGAGIALTLYALHRVVEEDASGAWMMVIALVPLFGPLAFLVAQYRERRRMIDWQEGRETLDKREAARRLMEIEGRRSTGVRLPAETKEAARLSFRLGRTDDAVTFSEEYLARFEDDHSARYLLARALAKAGKSRDALAAFQDVAQKDIAFDAGGALMGMARSFVELGDDVRAKLALDEVMARYSYPEPRFIAGEIAERAGDREEAVKQYTAAREAASSSSGHRKVLDRDWGRKAVKALERMKREEGGS